MAISLSTASLMASSPSPALRLPTRQPTASLASSSSLFFAQGRGGVALTRRTLDIAPRRRRSGGLGCVCLFGLGVPELVVIAGVAALVFGPKKLPEIGRGIGKTVKSFQQAAKEFETELKRDPEDSSQPPPAESPKAVNSEVEKKELEASNSKES